MQNCAIFLEEELSFVHQHNGKFISVHQQESLERYCGPTGDRSFLKRSLHSEKALWQKLTSLRMSL